MYNPLYGESGAGEPGERRPREVWNPIAEQLYNAIMWVIVSNDEKILNEIRLVCFAIVDESIDGFI